MRRRALLPLLALFSLAADCTGEEEYERFNGSDSLTVQVGPDLLEPVSVELTSTTGANAVGEASVDPGGAPVGSFHVVRVQVDPAYANKVDRVSVSLDSGDRGVRELDLVQDSADEGLYILEIQSVGDDAEERTDTLEVQLWDDLGDVDDASDSGA